MQEEKDVRSLSKEQKYTLTAAALGIFTAIEVLVLYPPLAEAGDYVKIALLAFLGFTKFVVVVALFMHLAHDSPLLTGIFTLGLVIGAGTLVGLLAVFKYYPLPENAVKARPLEEIFRERQQKRQQHKKGDGHACLPLHLVRVPVS